MEHRLSTRWRRRARRLNPYYQTRLGWRVPPGWPSDVGSLAFAERVAAFQNEHGQLTVDGILGPKTWAALSTRWRRRARRLNPYYQTRLGWRVPPGWPSDVGSLAFAERVASFQDEHGQLTVDGILGPKTWAALQDTTWTPPAGDHLIIAGQRVPVPFPVVTWRSPEGLSFYGQRGWRRRHDASGRGVDLFVLHWDGCTSAHQCFRVLLHRGLSVHLLLDGDGTVYQALDLAEACAWHAGLANQRSIGVEIQNPVKLHRNQWQTPPRAVITEAQVHRTGTWQHLDFYDVQKRRTAQLAEVLCERFGIPRALPRADGRVLRSLAPGGFRGVCGHYHVSATKPDPGLSLWPTLERAFHPHACKETNI